MGERVGSGHHFHRSWPVVGGMCDRDILPGDPGYETARPGLEPDAGLMVIVSLERNQIICTGTGAHRDRSTQAWIGAVGRQRLASRPVPRVTPMSRPRVTVRASRPS